MVRKKPCQEVPPYRRREVWWALDRHSDCACIRWGLAGATALHNTTIHPMPASSSSIIFHVHVLVRWTGDYRCISVHMIVTVPTHSLSRIIMCLVCAKAKVLNFLCLPSATTIQDVKQKGALSTRVVTWSKKPVKSNEAWAPLRREYA